MKLNVSISKISILGLGLIGGSMASALKRAGFPGKIVGYGRTEDSLERAFKRGLIDYYTLNLESALEDADLVVVAAPALASEEILREILPKLDFPEGPIITDVASVKGNLLTATNEVCETFPSKLILGHPIAGSHKSGSEASRADLFDGHRVIITPLPSNDKNCIELVAELWRQLGAEVVEMTVADHDEFLAATSHLPHALAFTLVKMLTHKSKGNKIFQYTAGGFRDFTRIAGSDPIIWRDISLANRKEMLKSIDHFISDLGDLRLAIEQNDASSLLDIYSSAKKARDTFI